MTRWLRALGAFLILVALVAGTPIFLATLVGNPWPAISIGLTTASISTDAIVALLAIVGWLMWAQFTAFVFLEVAGTVSRRGVPALSPAGLHGQQQLIHALVVAIAAAIVGIGVTSAVASPATAVSTVASEPAGIATVPASAPTSSETVEVVVTVGDNFWDLAETHLGDGLRWQDIVNANEGLTMTDGTVFHGHGRLMPGWVLKIPTGPEAIAGAPAAGGEHIVKVGETLSGVARQELGNASLYPQIAQASGISDPNVIYPGEILHLGTAAQNTSAPAPAEQAPVSADVAPTTPQEVSAAAAAPSLDGSIDAAPAASVDVEDDDSAMPGWVLPGLAAGGALLAGSLFVVMGSRRRSQDRRRRPGRVPATPPAAALVAERSIVAAGAASAEILSDVDDVLRRLAATMFTAGGCLPQLAALEIDPDAYVLHLHRAHAGAPAPWEVLGDGLTWQVSRSVDRALLGERDLDRPAPWPLLVTVGSDASIWLLNLEGTAVTVTGDGSRTRDFARWIGAEVAVNPWSSATSLDLVGAGEELARIDPGRIHHHATARSAATTALTDAVATIDRLDISGDLDPSNARAANTDPDPWPSRLVIIEGVDDSTELAQLMNLVGTQRAKTATAVVISGREAVTGLNINISSAGRLTVPAVGLDLEAVGLTKTEAEACTALLTHLEITGDDPAPDLTGDDPWQSLVATTGALRAQYGTDRHTATIEPAASMLNEPDEVYIEKAAATGEDLAQLAPKVSDTTAAQIAAADPNLDLDLAEWDSADSTRPRLSVLGPVFARTGGQALHKRRPYYTELLAYLASRPNGATVDEVAAAMDVTASRVRTDVNQLRSWLGTDTAGEKYLPDARTAPAALERGVPVYQVPAVLTDFDLFRRLRLRAASRGPEGIEDLQRALSLVHGRPYEKLRPGGWGWMLEGDRADQHAVCAVVDVAHIVVTDKLARGDAAAARAAVSVALAAAPDEEIARLDLAAVLQAEGRRDQADALVVDDICNRSDDGNAPVELAERSEQIIEAHRWARRDVV